ncbi:SlyX family protein [Kordiimonas sp.]|uniref:SlyX family protein n=1 Tax=Kordiimonas sp. TaxID=1970157 RepID=UPI003A95C332
MTDSSEQIADLEIRFAFMQETIDTLNETVTAQWGEIDRLKRRLEKLQAEVIELEDGGRRDSKSEPPPPHY